MFEDIIKEPQKKEQLQVFANTDCCPFCGSEEIGVSVLDHSGKETAMFCSVCGNSWLVE